jgi:hypothetical protein
MLASYGPEAIAMVVVHGVGDPRPGEALADFTDSLEHAGIATFDDAVRLQRLPSSAESTSTHTSYFPARMRHGTVARGGPPIVAAEVYWGSASQLAPGRLGVLQGVVSLILNVPAVVFAADVRGAGWLRGTIQKLAWGASLLLSGPAFALNALLLAMLFIRVAAGYVAGAPGSDWNTAIPVAAACLTGGLGFVRWFWFPESRWSFWLVGPAMLAITAIVSRVSTSAIVWAAAVSLVVVVAAVAALLLLAALAYVAGTLARALDATATTVILGASLQFGLWTLAIPTSWQLLFRILPSGTTGPFTEDLLRHMAAADGVQWVLAAAVLLVAVVVVGVREIAARREARASHPKPAPRLIVNPAIAVTVIAATIAGCAIVLAVVLFQRNPASGLAGRIPYGAAAKVLLVLLPVVVKPLRIGLDLTQDVIFYVHHSVERGRRVLSRARLGHEQRGRNPVRERFHAVVEHLRERYHVSHLVIVAHSQGTVIALDELAHSWRKDDGVPPVTFVTFGSPVTHLYQRYFPNEYPGWTQAQWTLLFERVRCWINCYRIGDYVGATIADPGGRCAFHQEVLGAGGHGGYWSDPRLMAALRQHAMFAGMEQV